ncbi:SDR family NAD(P)-dependent oxidoreductase [Streptomyces violaceus]
MQNRKDDPRDVVVVTGAGGMGTAVARRLGSGRTLILADHSRERLDQVVAELSAEGYAVRGVPTDVSDRASVEELARLSAEQGRITAVVRWCTPPESPPRRPRSAESSTWTCSARCM